MALLLTVRVWIIVVHSVATAFMVATALMYTYFLTDSHVGTSMTQLSANIDVYFVPTIVVAALTALGHALLGLRVVVKLIMYRTTVPSRAWSRRGGSSSKSTHIRPPTQVSPQSVSQRARSVASHCLAHIKTIWQERGAEIVRLFMIWDVALQTYQANKISQLVTSPSINRIMAAIIIANCWFSPILHYALAKRPRVIVRIHRLLIDSLLDVTYSVAIPISIIYPYVHDYIGGLALFPSTLYYMDTWYINAVSEMRQVFITSWLDFVSKFSGSLGLLYRLYVLWDTISAAQRRSKTHPLAPTPGIVPPKKSVATRFLDGVLVLWGVAVLGVHLQVTLTAYMHYDSHCLLEMRPWGRTVYTCAAFEVSCPSLNTPGDLMTTQNIIGGLEPETLQILIFADCEALQVPPAIQRLHNLMTLKLYNSTIASWDDQAALRESLHPSLQTIYFVRVTMSALPPGLFAPDFPSSVWAVVFCTASLANFPDEIGARWRGVRVMVVEGNKELTKFPDAMYKLPLANALGLRHNSIQVIPDQVMTKTSLIAVDFAGNPVQKLPESLASRTSLVVISIVRTNVSTIPRRWHETAPQNPGQKSTMIATDTPLCASVGTDPELEAPEWIQLLCLQDPLPTQFFYPLDEEDEWRAQSRARFD